MSNFLFLGDYIMAREWEEKHTEVFDPRVEGRFYVRYNKRTAAREERLFRPEALTDQDLREGDTRRFILDDGYGDLDDVLREKNSFEGLY
jgi:hypothetical protein